MSWSEPIKNREGKSPRHQDVSIKKSLKSTSRIAIVPKIINSGYPTNSPLYPSAHKKACGHEISKFGISNFLSLEKVVSDTPKDELLGTHDQDGNIKVSSRVPPEFVQEVTEHEELEHSIMASETFFKKLQDTYKQYHFDLVLQRSNPLLSSSDAEFLQREFIIKIRPNVKDYNLHLAHETAHALEHIYGKMGKIDTHIYGGTSTGMGMFLKKVSPQILQEISMVVSHSYSDKSFQIYSNDLSEQFARFVAEMIIHPQKTEKLAPNAVELFKQKFKELR